MLAIRLLLLVAAIAGALAFTDVALATAPSSSARAGQPTAPALTQLSPDGKTLVLLNGDESVGFGFGRFCDFILDRGGAFAGLGETESKALRERECAKLEGQKLGSQTAGIRVTGLRGAAVEFDEGPQLAFHRDGYIPALAGGSYIVFKSSAGGQIVMGLEIPVNRVVSIDLARAVDVLHSQGILLPPGFRPTPKSRR